MLEVTSVRGLGLCAVFISLMFVSACGSSPSERIGNHDWNVSSRGMKLGSPVFEGGGRIPLLHTCDGEDISPPLSISGVPGSAKSLALVVVDLQATGTNFLDWMLWNLPITVEPAIAVNRSGVFVHWMLWNVPPDLQTLPKNLTPRQHPSYFRGTVQGANDFGQPGYSGPCPPVGPPHTYEFQLHALDRRLDLAPGTGHRDLYEPLKQYTVARAVLMGRYEPPLSARTENPLCVLHDHGEHAAPCWHGEP